MFCMSCGSPIDDDSVFCGVCGSKIDREFLQGVVDASEVAKEEVNDLVNNIPDIEEAIPQVEEVIPEVEAVEEAVEEAASAVSEATEKVEEVAKEVEEEVKPEEAPAIPVTPVIPAAPAANESIMKGDFVPTKEEPMKVIPNMKPPKAPKGTGAKIVCTFFTIIFALVLFAFTIVLFIQLVAGDINITGSKSLVRPFKAVEISEIEIGEFVNQAHLGEKVKDDCTVSEFVYVNIPEEYKEDIREKDVKEVIDRLDISGFTDDMINKYTLVVLGDEKEASVTAKDIEKLCKDNKEVFDDVLGDTMGKNSYTFIVDMAKDSKIDKITKVKSDEFEDFRKDFGLEDDGDEKGILRQVYDHRGLLLYATIGVMALLLIIILLLNLDKPYVTMWYLGLSGFFTGLCGFATVIFFDTLVELSSEEFEMAEQFIEGLVGSLKNSILLMAIIFFAVGFVLMVTSSITKRVVRKKRKKYAAKYEAAMAAMSEEA